AQDETQEGGLAGAGGPDQEGELALLDLQVDIPQRGTSLALVRLGDLLESNHRLRQWPVSGKFGVPPRRPTAFGSLSTAPKQPCPDAPNAGSASFTRSGGAGRVAHSA